MCSSETFHRKKISAHGFFIWSWCHRESPGLDRFLQLSRVIKFFSQYYELPMSKQFLILKLFHPISKDYFFWNIKSFLLKKVPQSIAESAHIKLVISVSDSEIFSYFGRYNLFIIHSFKVVANRIPSDATTAMHTGDIDNKVQSGLQINFHNKVSFTS